MKVWIYARLSNDDDQEQNSLLNQQEICKAYAEQHNHQIVGISFDDNVSGMTFERRGLDQLTVAAEAGQIEAVIAKDLSRLGRHRTQTALFLDYLRERGVRVLSVTEGLDTFREEDDLIVGVRGLMNDYYAKDIGKKIRAGYRQKQKDGIVITPPFGYWKDKNTGRVQIQPEAAETVRLIFSLYLSGHGQKEISRRLNQLGRRTPAQLRAERCGKESATALWTYSSVKNILVEETYTGVLINHRHEFHGLKRSKVPKDAQFRHPDYYPPIISPEDWAATQELLKAKAPPAPCNQTKHRYAGLLKCQECGSPFVPMVRYWNGKRRVEYVCKTYHRLRKDYCSSHRIHEEVLDAEVLKFATACRQRLAEELLQLKQLEKMWALRKPFLDAHIVMLQGKIQKLELEIDELVMSMLKT